VLGRTLSSYFAGDVQNQQETITYTVYNLSSDPDTGVLLTTTLEPGVTLKSASQQPDQSGQNLAWSLGTIGAFDRASVSVTVALANPIPMQLDSGASAFAILDGAPVMAATPAATLSKGSAPADGSGNSLLESTPDANTTDPYIEEAAAELDYNPQNIFAFLHQNIGYNDYAGSMRGARGTLWSQAGNALDVASLGVALFRASGIPAQYAEGTVTEAQAQQLILSMFPTPFQVSGYLPSGTATSDPADDPGLQASAES
jgi:transglutaminase-like putative cysteine protease